MRLTVFLILLSCAAVLFAWPIAAHPLGLIEEDVLHTMRADYLEDEQTGRRLAAIETRLVVTGPSTATLYLIVEATGPNIDPVPSFRGVHGSNHITARDLTDLMAKEHLKVVVLPRAGAGKRFGRVVIRSRGRVQERRQHPDGSVQPDAASAHDYVLGIEASTPELEPGEHEVYLEVKRLPRLRVDVRVERTNDGSLTGSILAIESLGDHNVAVRK